MAAYRDRKTGELYLVTDRALMGEDLLAIFHKFGDDQTTLASREDAFGERFEAVGSYYLERRGYSLAYYKSGENRGWKSSIEEATLYSDKDFAQRDLGNLFPTEERRLIHVRSLFAEEYS